MMLWVLAALIAETLPPPPGPEIAAASVALYPDQGRLELKGTRLAGLRVRWQAETGSGEAVCAAPTPPPPGTKEETCTLALAHNLPANAPLQVLGPEAAATAKPAASAPAAAPAGVPLHPARIILDKLLPTTAAVDLTGGVGRIPLVHPEAVAAVDCSQARCELSEGAVLVRAVPASATTLTLRLRLTPGMFLAHGDATDVMVARAIAVVHCQAAIVSGAPLRHAEGTRIILRADARCGREASDLTWSVNGEPATVQQVVNDAADHGAVYVQLGAGDIGEAQVTVTATRPEPDGSVVAVARAATKPAPQPRVALTLPGFGRIGFIPTNRDALLTTAPVGDHARLVALREEGAYRVSEDSSGVHVRGEDSAAGFVALRFGYRVDTLPAALAATDLAVLTEPLQRPIREASVPAPFSSSALGGEPLIELLCADGAGRFRRLGPGVRASIPFSQRDSCHLVIHRERLRPEDGIQDITVEVNVSKVDDSPRAESHVSERMVLRPGGEPRVFWIHGVKGQFDRVTVRVSHVIDEAHDVGGAELQLNLPSAQWAVVVGQGRFRFYATAAIPTGLFRITPPSDVLTLNFGALSRLTWLDREGHEGLLGLEFGAMGIGLAATPGFPRTLAVLGGVGVSVPIGNRGETSQASVNLHAWGAYELRDQFQYQVDPPNGPFRTASHWSFLFGPSITIGNVGINL
jgi:hypothetical protein